MCVCVWYQLTQVVLEKKPLNGCSGGGGSGSGSGSRRKLSLEVISTTLA